MGLLIVQIQVVVTVCFGVALDAHVEFTRDRHTLHVGRCPGDLTVGHVLGVVPITIRGIEARCALHDRNRHQVFVGAIVLFHNDGSVRRV